MSQITPTDINHFRDHIEHGGLFTNATGRRLLAHRDALEARVRELEGALEEYGVHACPQCGKFSDDFCSHVDDSEAFCHDCYKDAPYQCDKCSFRCFEPKEFDGVCANDCDGTLTARAALAGDGKGESK
jgi:hypothetical protein